MQADLSHYTPRPHPGMTPMTGRFAVVVRVDRAHLRDLYESFTLPGSDRLWDYLPYGPFANYEAFERFAEATYFGDDPCFYSVIDRGSGKALGVLSLMRIDRANGVIELGNICFSPALQRSRIASEAFHLALRRVFGELGYRRYEWKCNNDNAPSHVAAKRLGFRYEGLFRQHMIVKQRNRDTAWYSIIDSEWPALDAAYAAYLDDANYDAEGRQAHPLRHFMAEAAR
ncbi:GNAT family protein [Aureimonas altamirensis]|uniref:GNAT family N-acetyltransferase n=1 Tax=Aureimonas altamirensis TaxID=370622 RepID=UPI00301A398B